MRDEASEQRARDLVLFLFQLKQFNSARYRVLVSQRKWLEQIGLTKRELERLLEAFRFFIECGIAIDALAKMPFDHCFWVFEQARNLRYRSEEAGLLFKWASNQSTADIRRQGKMISQKILEEDSTENRRLFSQLSSQILRGKDRWPVKPDVSSFIVSDSDWRQLCLNVHRAAFCLLIGPSGCGKTELVRLLCSAMKRNLHAFSFGGCSDPRTFLVGSREFDPKRGTFFVASRFLQAIQEPQAVIRLDEINRCDAFTNNCLFSVLDKQRSLDVDENGTVVKVHDTVSFFGTANVGFEYVGANKMDQALLDRADVIIRLSYPAADVETKLLIERTGIAKKTAELLTTIANEQRRLAEKQEFAHGLSIRRLLGCAEQISLGVPLKEAIYYNLTTHFSDEGAASSDSCRFQQFLQKFGL